MSIVFGVVYYKGGMMFQRRKLEAIYSLSFFFATYDPGSR